MTIIHIFKNTNPIFYKPYIKFINTNFVSTNHYFFIEKYEKKPKEDFDYKNIEFVNIIGYLKLIKSMYNSEKIILHSLFSPRMLVILFLQPWLLKKCFWVIWGGDLYYYRSEKLTIKSKILEMIRRKVIQNVGSIISLVKADYNLAIRWYGTKAKYYHGMYVVPINTHYLDSLPKKIGNEKINIQIGNSGDPSNHHIEVLKNLQRFKDENINIFIPLSYGGTDEYKKEVIKYGSEFFGDKFVPMLDFLEPDKYAKYLSSIDIAIFNNDRQQALGNIFALLYLEKKVYIRSDTGMWDHFTNFLNLKMYDIEDLKQIDINEFLIHNTGEKNKLGIKKAIDEKNLVRIWSEIFS